MTTSTRNDNALHGFALDLCAPTLLAQARRRLEATEPGNATLMRVGIIVTLSDGGTPIVLVDGATHYMDMKDGPALLRQAVLKAMRPALLDDNRLAEVQAIGSCLETMATIIGSEMHRPQTQLRTSAPTTWAPSLSCVSSRIAGSHLAPSVPKERAEPDPDTVADMPNLPWVVQFTGADGTYNSERGASGLVRARSWGVYTLLEDSDAPDAVELIRLHTSLRKDASALIAAAATSAAFVESLAYATSTAEGR